MYSPGTVIISAGGEVTDIKKLVEPIIRQVDNTSILYIDLSSFPFSLGGSSFAQTQNKLGLTAPTIKDSAYFKKVFQTIQKMLDRNLILAGHDVSSGGLITTLLEMVFSDNDTSLKIDITPFEENDEIKIFFSENPALLIQVNNDDKAIDFLKNEGVHFKKIAQPVRSDIIEIQTKSKSFKLDKSEYRDYWFETSYHFDCKQSGDNLAAERYQNYKTQEMIFTFPDSFNGKLSSYGIKSDRPQKTGIRAAIIREKGVNGDREMAYSMYLAGMDVKDVHMTDLISGRETLEDINFIVFVGGFSNSDVLGSAKGWAGAFLFNEKAQKSLDKFYARKDTLSLGVCNGCQLMIELGLINPEHEEKPKMLRNDSGKFESSFLNVTIPENNSVMLQSLAGSRMGIWVAHGEGKFDFPYEENKYHVALKYSNKGYPGNPNGSAFNVAGICSEDGRHLAMMPHLERAIFPWQWGYYPSDRNDEASPWLEAFVNAREWIKKHM